MNSFEYLQPDSYHFSLDSVEFAQFVSLKVVEKWGDSISSLKILDACAGTGIVGLDLAYHLSKIQYLDFLEIQSEFELYLEENRNRLLELRRQRGEFSILNSKFIFANYELLNQSQFKDSYDLILCNPPFFINGTGKIPPNALKARCHFFIDSSPEQLLRGMVNALRPNGVAYFLCKDERVEEAFIANAQSIEVAKIGKVRNTGVMELKKSARNGLIL